MQQIRTRAALLEFVKTSAPSKACVTALRQDRARIFRIPSVDLVPRYRVEVESEYGRKWVVLVGGDVTRRRYVANWGLTGMTDGELISGERLT